MGFTFSQMLTFMDLAAVGFEFYNDCKFDYYLQSIGSNTQSVAGLANFGTTVGFRLLDSEDTTLTDLADAFTAWALGNDADTREDLGLALGAFVRTVLSVEIPDTSIDIKPFYESGSSFGRRRR